VAFNFTKPTKTRKVKHTVESAVAEHARTTKALDDTLNRTGEWDYKQLLRDARNKAKRDGGK